MLAQGCRHPPPATRVTALMATHPVVGWVTASSRRLPCLTGLSVFTAYDGAVTRQSRQHRGKYPAGLGTEALAVLPFALIDLQHSPCGLAGLDDDNPDNGDE
jgi:hypothetical protein